MSDVAILGIDPGSRATGYGVIFTQSGRIRHLAHGVIRAPKTELGERLVKIHEGVVAVVQQYRPGEIAVEKAFVHKNVASALALGQARGAAIAGSVGKGRPLYEYAPRQVKAALAGTGAAGKDQVALMVRALLHLSGPLPEDAADALAIAICHAHHREMSSRLAALP